MSGLATGIASAAISLGGSVGSFIQAGKRNKDMKEAEAAAEAAMSEARRRTEVNYMKQLGIQKEAYRQAYEAGSVANKAMIDAAQQQGQRGVAAVAGQVSQAALSDAQKVRATQEGEMVARQQAIAQEDSRLRDINVQLDLEEVAGAQQAAEDARIAKNMAIQEGISGLTDAAMTGVESIALFPRKKGGKKTGQYSDRMVEVPGLTGSDKVTFNPTGTDRPTIGTQADTMNVDPNMGSSPMETMETITLKSGTKPKTQTPANVQVKLTDEQIFEGLERYKTPAEIKQLQQGLVDRGFSVGSSGIDGILGKDTRAAYLKYRRRND